MFEICREDCANSYPRAKWVAEQPLTVVVRRVPAENARFELSAEERSALDRYGETMFGELHAEMRAQQYRRLQLVPGFLQIAAVTVTATFTC